jgi:hypothetical protein
MYQISFVDAFVSIFNFTGHKMLVFENTSRVYNTLVVSVVTTSFLFVCVCEHIMCYLCLAVNIVDINF